MIVRDLLRVLMYQYHKRIVILITECLRKPLIFDNR